MVELDLSEMSHQGDYVGLWYCLIFADRYRPVRVCDRARTPRDEPMAFRLPHSLQDALRYALRSQKTGVRSRVSPYGFDHRGAFADAFCILGRSITCDSNQHEQ